MKDLETRIETLLMVFDRWLSDDNEYLLQAVHQTVKEGYFSFPDVQFALKALQENLHGAAIKKWVRRGNITDNNDAGGNNVLCLHAGNLPLVGFQDALAVLLSGARYTGKISRKDPYLLPAFLNEVKKTEVWGSADVQWSHRLDDFEDMRHDLVLFAGSEQSVPGVKSAIQNFHLIKKDAHYLIRKTHFSLAYFDQKNRKNMDDLAASVLRYGGKGCRSVAVVVSPFPFDSLKEELSIVMKSFLEENPQQDKPKPKLRQRFAYNKAIGRSQLWLSDFLLQENGLELDQDFICYWVRGKKGEVFELARKYNRQLQSIYVTEQNISKPNLKKSASLKLLSNAQRPPVSWRPDGMDVLQWLCRW